MSVSERERMGAKEGSTESEREMVAVKVVNEHYRKGGISL